MPNLIIAFYNLESNIHACLCMNPLRTFNLSDQIAIQCLSLPIMILYVSLLEIF